MKKVFKYALASVIYAGFILAIQDAGEQVGFAVGELVSDGIKEIPEEVSGIKAVTKKIILKEREFLKNIFSHKKEEDIVLTKDDEDTLKDIEKEVSQL